MYNVWKWRPIIFIAPLRVIKSSGACPRQHHHILRVSTLLLLASPHPLRLNSTPASITTPSASPLYSCQHHHTLCVSNLLLPASQHSLHLHSAPPPADTISNWPWHESYSRKQRFYITFTHTYIWKDSWNSQHKENTSEHNSFSVCST